MTSHDNEFAELDESVSSRAWSDALLVKGYGWAEAKRKVEINAADGLINIHKRLIFGYRKVSMLDPRGKIEKVDHELQRAFRIRMALDGRTTE